MKSLCNVIIVLALILTNVSIGTAGDNHLDYTFHADGKTSTTYLANSNDEANAVAIYNGSQFVVAGVTDNAGAGNDFLVMRYNDTGGLDTSFGTNGKVTTDFGGNETARAIVVSGGKIIVVGSVIFPGAIHDFVVARYNADGSLDNTFSGDGRLVIDFQGGNDSGRAVSTDGDKLLVAGSVDSGLAWGVARINSDGTLDTTFSGDGKVITDVGTGTEIAYGVLSLSNGKVLATGVTSRIGATDGDFALVRYNSNGTLDTTFDTDGKVITDFNGLDNWAYTVKAHANNFILAGESYSPGGAHYLTLARYNDNGSLDTSFNGIGYVFTDLNPTNGESAYAMAINAFGQIVVAGSAFSSNPGIEHFILFRYNHTGTRDRTFGTNGRVNTIFGPGGAQANGIAIRPGLVTSAQDEIVAVGTYSPPNQDTDFAVAKYYVDGPAAPSQFHSNGEGDFAVFRPSDGNWYALHILSSTFDVIHWGQAGDVPVPGDYDKDGFTDAAVFRNGNWYIRRSSDSGATIVQFGLPGDKPVQGDYDGDGFCDIAVYRPSNGVWHLLRSRFGYTSLAFGLSDDKPSQGDFDGDGLTDVAVFRASSGTWYIQRSILGFYAAQFGANGDRPVPSDYDGDGKTDIAIYRPSTGVWYTINSQSNTNLIVQFGISTDIPGPADFDGDGKADLTVFRPSTGVWYSLKTTNGSALIWAFGSNGDIPVSASYTPQ